MGNTPEQQQGQKDLTPEDREVAAEVLKAEKAAGIEHPELKGE